MPVNGYLFALAFKTNVILSNSLFVLKNQHFLHKFSACYFNQLSQCLVLIMNLGNALSYIFT